MKPSNWILGIAFFVAFPALSQDELMDLLQSTSEETKKYTTATFKSTRLINGHSIETRTAGILEFVISHRFGRINTGIDEFFGLDNANIRFGLEYGVTDQLNIGVGRSSFDKVYDGFIKYKALRQSTTMPVSVTAFASATSRTADFPDDGQEYLPVHRWAYTTQLLIAHKVNTNVSLQVMPSWVHRNLVFSEEDSNDVFAVGFGGRVKLTNRIALNAEYYLQTTDHAEQFTDALAIGFDIETGGHVFQLHFTNAQQMIEKGFIAETTGDFFSGDIHFGFNVSRVFNLRKGE